MMLTLLYFQFFSLSSAPVASIQQALGTQLISSCPAPRIIRFPLQAMWCERPRAYGTHEYARQWLGKKTQICGNLSGEHNDAREDNLADGRVHSPIPQWLHEPSPPRSGTGECAAPRPAAAAVHAAVQRGRGSGSWLAKGEPLPGRLRPSSRRGQEKLVGWLARNLPRLVIHVAVMPVVQSIFFLTGEFEVVSFCSP